MNGFRKPHGQAGDAKVRLHQATCSQCGKMCEVPFKPNGKKPVYCRDCFGGHKASTLISKEDAPVFEDKGDMRRQIDILHSKLDRIIRILETRAPEDKMAGISSEALKNTVVKKRIVVARKRK